MPPNVRVLGICSVCEREMLLAIKNPPLCHTDYEKKRQAEGKAPKNRDRKDQKAYYQANKERIKAKQKERYDRLKAEGKPTRKRRSPSKPRVSRQETAERMAEKKAYEEKKERLALSRPLCSYCDRVVLKDGFDLFEDKPIHRVCMYAQEARRNIRDRSRSTDRQDQ